MTAHLVWLMLILVDVLCGAAGFLIIVVWNRVRGGSS